MRGLDQFPSLIRMHWESILTKLKAGSYQPSPVKRIYIIPPSSGSAVSLRFASVVCAADAAKQSKT